MIELKNVNYEQYVKLIKYASKKCDAFCLVLHSAFPYKLPPNYINSEFAEKLEPYLLHQTNRAKKWPGTHTNVKYLVLNVYKFIKGSRFIISEVSGFDFFENQDNSVEDLCLLIDHKAWLISVSHEKMYFINNETDEDIIFFKSNGFDFRETLADGEYYNQCYVEY